MTETAVELELDDQLCFALYAASRAMTSRYRPRLDALGLTYPQYLVLIVLWDEGETSVAKLCDRLQLDSGTLSPLLKRLEVHGLVTRTRSTTDERSVLVAATAAAHALRDKAAQIPVDITASLDNCPEIEGIDVDELRSNLRRLAIALRDV